jgi:hypothetical protein
VLGIGLQDGVVALGEDVGRCEHLHEARTTALRVRCDGGQMLSDRSSASMALVPAVAAGAASTDPSGVTGWLPSAAAFTMVAPCRGEFVVDHAEICSDEWRLCL